MDISGMYPIQIIFGEKQYNLYVKNAVKIDEWQRCDLKKTITGQ